MLRIIKFFTVSAFFILNTACVYADGAKIKDIEKIKKAIVTVNSRVPVIAYKQSGSWEGTGFIADKKNGYLITNNHVVGRAAIGTYYVTFHNGQQTEAKVVYYDAYADFAILKIDPKDFPAEIEHIEFTKNIPTAGENVLILGNNEAQGFSFHSGYISDLYEISGEMPQGSYVINMNTAGGSSGSPVLNSENKAIGVHYGGGKTYSLTLKSSYVQHALTQIQSGEDTPTRKHIGVITSLYSLDKAVKHRNFSKSDMDEYIKKYPNARNRVVVANSIIPNSTAESVILPGDILWAANGKNIAADLTILDRQMDISKDSINLTIIRNGIKIEKSVKLYDLNERKITRMLDFAGGLFFEVDDYCAAKSGVPLGSVALVKVQTGSSFSSISQKFTQNNQDIYRIVINSLNNKKILSLDDLINIAKSAVSQKYVNLEYQNFQPYYPHFGDSFLSGHENFMQDITFDSIDANPRILQYNTSDLIWTPEDIK